MSRSLRSAAAAMAISLAPNERLGNGLVYQSRPARLYSRQRATSLLIGRAWIAGVRLRSSRGGSMATTEARGQPVEQAREEHPAHSRLRGYSALLITLIAALGAIVTWRAEVAATKAAELNQRGVVIAINLGAEQSMDRAQAMGAAADVPRVQQLLDERNLLGNELSLTPPGPAKTRLGTDYS